MPSASADDPRMGAYYSNRRRARHSGMFRDTAATMEATVIDTLRYADRVKAAGVEPNEAQAMSRALNEERAGGVATKDDLVDEG